MSRALTKRPGDMHDAVMPKPNVIYFLQSGSDGPIKIGRTSNLPYRIKWLQTSHHEPLRLLGALEAPASEEKRLHALFVADKARGEWFRPSEAIKKYVASLPPWEQPPKASNKGPGRPRWVSRRDEVRLSPEDEAMLENWLAYSGESERSRAFRRALHVVDALREYSPALLRQMVKKTEGVLR